MCATKQKEWAARQEMRGQEKLALADTIKILNDDDALELFKKTLPGSSLLQVKISSREVLNNARSALKAAQKGKHDPRLGLISLALLGKKVSLDGIVKMVEKMIENLHEEQEADDHKKEHCLEEFDLAEDKKKELDRAISKLEEAIDENKAALASLEDEIKALAKGIEESDKAVAEATEQRKEENEDFQTTLAANTAAVELIGVAKNRMNKFYNPKLYKAPPKKELTDDERNILAAGGTLAPTAAPGGIAGTGVLALLQTSQNVAPPPPPETFDAYSKKSEESNGVVGMMDALIADVEKENQEMEFEEKDAQKEYEEFMADSPDKRADDSKAIADKTAVKADTEALKAKNDETLHDKMTEAMAHGQFTAMLHGECDWLISNFETRKEARADEVENLKKADAALLGADVALVQKTSSTFLRKVSQHA
jgi:chromosome segregation ATPase